MPQKINRTSGKGIGLVLIICSICLVGITALSAFWQPSSWTNVLYLIQFTLVVIVFGTIGGMLWEGLVGQEKGLWSNLAGFVFILALLWYSGSILDVYNISTRESFSTWEKTVKMLSLGFGGGGAIDMGQFITRRYIKRVES